MEREVNQNGMRLQPALSSLQTVREKLAETGVPEKSWKRWYLACEEWFANIVDYSGATAVFFSLEEGTDAIAVSFRDNGRPFDPTAFSADEKEFDELDSGGMGLALIRQTASDWKYERADGENCVTMEFARG